MKAINKNSLLEFYFGTLEESRRLLVEKEMLTDPEILLDYFDLKRTLESAETAPQSPSPFLLQRLNRNFKQKRNWYVAFATVATAAAVIGFYMMAGLSQNPAPASLNTESGILFDSGREHSLASDVL